MSDCIDNEMLKKIRKQQKITQLQLAEILNVSDKAISKWETGRGFPDVTMIRKLADALNVSVIELLSGKQISNTNTCSNMLNSKIYTCPTCGNIIHTTGEAVISCCGKQLSIIKVNNVNEEHNMDIEKIENELYIKINHIMNKDHFISFVTYITSSSFEIVKFYPEMNAETRFRIKGHGSILAYCTKDGPFMIKI